MPAYPCFSEQHQDRWPEFAARDDRWNRPLEAFGITKPWGDLGDPTEPPEVVFNHAISAIGNLHRLFLNGFGHHYLKGPYSGAEKQALRLIGNTERMIEQFAREYFSEQLTPFRWEQHRDRVSAVYYWARFHIDEENDHPTRVEFPTGKEIFLGVYDTWPLLFNWRIYDDLHPDWVNWLNSYPTDHALPTVDQPTWFTRKIHNVWYCMRDIGIPPAAQPTKVESHAEFEYFLDLILLWCEKNGAVSNQSDRAKNLKSPHVSAHMQGTHIDAPRMSEAIKAALSTLNVLLHKLEALIPETGSKITVSVNGDIWTLALGWTRLVESLDEVARILGGDFLIENPNFDDLEPVAQRYHLQNAWVSALTLHHELQDCWTSEDAFLAILCDYLLPKDEQTGAASEYELFESVELTEKEVVWLLRVSKMCRDFRKAGQEYLARFDVPQGTSRLDAVQPISKSGQASKESHALAFLVEHPEWTNQQIADAIGCHVKSLSRWEKFKAARAALKEQGRKSLSQGWKDADGNMDATME